MDIEQYRTDFFAQMSEIDDELRYRNEARHYIQEETIVYDYAARLLRSKRLDQLTITEVRNGIGLKNNSRMWNRIRAVWKSIEQEVPKDTYIMNTPGYKKSLALSALVENPEGLSRAALIRSAREHGISVEDIRRVMKLKDTRAWQLAQTEGCNA